MAFKKTQKTQKKERTEKPKYEYEDIGYLKMYEAKEGAKYEYRIEFLLEDDQKFVGFLRSPNNEESKVALFASLFEPNGKGKIDFENQVGSVFLYENESGRGTHVLYGSGSLETDWETIRINVTVWEGDRYGDADYSGKVQSVTEIDADEEDNEEEEEPPKKTFRKSQNTTQKTEKQQKGSSKSTSDKKASTTGQSRRKTTTDQHQQTSTRSKTRVKNQEMVEEPELDEIPY